MLYATSGHLKWKVLVQLIGKSAKTQPTYNWTLQFESTFLIENSPWKINYDELSNGRSMQRVKDPIAEIQRKFPQLSISSLHACFFRLGSDIPIEESVFVYNTDRRDRSVVVTHH
jgi:hypothetical protein